MADRHFQVSVGTSAVVLPGTQYQGWILCNNSANTIYLGDSSVATSDGFPVEAGVYFSPSEIAHGSLTEKRTRLELYAVAGSAGNDVRILVPGRA